MSVLEDGWDDATKTEKEDVLRKDITQDHIDADASRYKFPLC